MIRDHIGIDGAQWLCRVNCKRQRFKDNYYRSLVFAVQIIQYVTCDPVKHYLLPVAEKLRHMAEHAYKEEVGIQ